MIHRLAPAVLRSLVLVSLVLAACGAGGVTPSPAASVPATASTQPSPAGSAEPSPAGSPGDDPAAGIGRAFVEALAEGNTAAAEALEDEAMRAAAPAATLGQLWDSLVAQYGAFDSIGGVTTAAQAPYTIASVETAFEKATVTLAVAIAGDGRVSGLHVTDVQEAAPGTSASPSESPAAYVDLAAFTERGVTVGSDPWALPGTLSMPNGEGPFPAVVLVAGSGPNDRDEKIGPNTPLRDLAWGLASAGIAVLRYDKRTLVHAAAMKADEATTTVEQEVVEDALAAIELLRSTPGVDPERVHLAGHSLGGYLAPRIAAEAPGALSGIVLLAASSSPLTDLILAQADYLASLEGSPSPEVEQQLATLREQVALAESGDLSPSTPASALPLGVPAAYWLDLREYDPAATAAGLAMPMLFVQGGRDYQVPQAELDRWRDALEGRTDVAYETYPDVDHLLMAGSGPSSPADYLVPGHVAGDVVADVAAWIKGR